MFTAKVRIHGRVQGVGFRYALRDVAESHNVTGWCRNLPDGDVEALYQGEQQSVQKLVNWSHEGPPMARVDEVTVEYDVAAEAVEGFAIRG